MHKQSDRETRRQRDRVGGKNLSGPLLLLLLLLVAGIASGQYSGTFTIKPTGGHFVSHAEAAESLMAYGVVGPCTLEMYTGVYEGQACFDTPGWDSVEVVFRAADGEEPVVRHNSYPWYIYYTDRIKIDGITSIGTSGYGAYVYYSDHFKAHNCNLTGSSYGIYMYYSDTSELVGCTASGSYGVMWYYSTRRKVVGNDIRPTSSYGMYLYNSSSQYAYYDTIANNMVYSPSGYAVYGYYSYYRFYAHNTIYGVSSYAMYDYYSYHTRMLCNIFTTEAYTYVIYRYGSIDTSDYNCWFSYAGYPWVMDYHRPWTWDDWTGLDLDEHSVYKDPEVGGPANLHIRLDDSPCIDAACPLDCFIYDIEGDARGWAPDIGADEFTGVGSPMAGTYLIHPHPDSGHYSSFNEAISDMVLRGYAGNITLNVAAGTYRENLVLSAMGNGPYSVTFQARGDGEVMLQAAGSYAIHLNTVSRFKFRGLTIQGAGYGVYMYYSGSSPYKGCDSIVIADCRIEGSSYAMYLYYGVDDCSIVGNILTSNSSYGIHMRGESRLRRCRNNVFANNLVQNWTGYGFYFYFHDNTTMIFNTLYGSGSYGMYDYYGYNPQTRHGNIYNGNTYGWYKYYGDAIPTYSNHNCFNGGSAAICHNSLGAITLAQWQSYSSRDAQSVQADPLCVSASDGHLRPQSPCRDTCFNYTGFPLDVDREARAEPRTDIGADDFQKSGSPLAGTYLIHQDPDSGDYTSFAEATDYLVLWGTAAACTFDVAGDTYREAVQIGDICGGHWVTFQARGYGTPNREQVVIMPYNNYVVALTGCEYVTFQGFELYQDGTSSYAGVRMYYQGTDGCDWCVIRDNRIHAYYGVYMYYYTNHCSIIGNITDGTGYYGCYTYGNSGNRNLGNVFINNMFAGSGYGLQMYYHDSTKSIYNSFSGANYHGWYDYYGYYEHMQNNAFYGNVSAWYKYYGSAIPLVSDYNCFWSDDSLGRVIGNMTLAEWQAYSQKDSNSIQHDPLFSSATDLHLRYGSPCRDSGLAIAAIPVDADGDTRDSTPDIGADEWRSPGPPLSGIYYIHPNPDSHDYSSFVEALTDLVQRGFGGDVTFRAYTGTYVGDINLSGIGNDTFELTLDAVEGETPVVQSASTYGIRMTANRNIRIEGLTINGYYAIYMNYTGTDGCDNNRIINNKINAGYMGIYMCYYGKHNEISGNTINTAGYYGIYAYGNSSNRPTGNRFYNNMIISDYGYGYGTYFYYQDSLEFIYNSMYGRLYYGLHLYHSTNCTIRNNVVYNTYNSTSCYVVYDYQNTSAQEWDWNCLYGPNCTIAYKDGSSLDWSGWQAAGRDSNGINANPYYVGTTDLHLQDSSPCIGAADPVEGILTDLDGDDRHPVHPDIGADEWRPASTGIVEGAGKPLYVDLLRPTPNPAAGPVRIRWQVPRAGRALLRVFDLSGRCVNTLVDGRVETGVYVTTWHGRDDLGRRLSPGIYFCTLEAGDKKLTHKVVLTGVR